jgi:hypothetical protein
MFGISITDLRGTAFQDAELNNLPLRFSKDKSLERNRTRVHETSTNKSQAVTSYSHVQDNRFQHRESKLFFLICFKNCII